MGWLRSAMHKAAEVRGRAGFRAAVRSYTGNVVNNDANSGTGSGSRSVSGSAKKSQDRVATQNIKSYKEEVKRLEEVSVSSKGEERVQLLRTWLASLREIESLNADSVERSSENPHTSSDKNDYPEKSTVVLYHDPDLGVSPVNFRDVFLHSQALEGITMSMIIGAPNEEEILLLSELFGLCLTGGKEVHDVIVKRIQGLAKAFSGYDDEVLAKRGELLQFAQDAISGLKVNADILRIDSEVSQIHQNLKKMEQKKLPIEDNESSSEATDDATLEVIKESVAPIQLCCKLESLLQKKRLLNNGDMPQIHAHKVDKLKILSESLLGSASKTEKRISDHRQQKEEALHFRVAKTSEVSQIEKDLGAEISVLEKQRDELEAELKKVKGLLAVANARLQNAKEEREQFDDASNQLLVHFKAKEDELSKAIVSYRAEADTCSAFVDFLEATWAFQSSFVEQKDKKVNDELDNHEEYFVNVAWNLLSAYKDALGPAMTDLRKHMKNLKRYEKVVDPDEEFLQDIEKRKGLEQAYQAAETKLITIFDAVESVKEQFYSTIDPVSRKGAEPVNELCDAIEKIKGEFETLARPNSRNDKPSQGEQVAAKESPKKVASPSSKRALAADIKSMITQKLVTRPQKTKPYIPLGGSCENSPSKEKSDAKPIENEQDKPHLTEGEKSSNLDKEASKLDLEISNKDITEEDGVKSDAKKTDQDVEETPSRIDKEAPESHDSREQEKVEDESAESQESNTSRACSSEDEKLSEPAKESWSSASEKEDEGSNDEKVVNSENDEGNSDENEDVNPDNDDGNNDEKEGVNPKNDEGNSDENEDVNPKNDEGNNDEKGVNEDNETPKMATEVTEVGGKQKKTAETEQSKTKTPDSSSSESESSSESDNEPPKSTSGVEKDEQKTE